MDDKKNVSFVSGLALILSALALLLIGIQQISATPYTETLEKIVNAKLEDLEARMETRIDYNIKRLSKAEESAALRQLKFFNSGLDAWLQSGANGYSGDVQAIKEQIDGLVAKMEGMPPAPKAPAVAADTKSE
ncbi:MAG: hypothetical protein M5R36_12745 [Deltaproteobacteria bacterium]|nr:hypothetical protein [Deltaproteobacteria bacterium]